MYVKVRRKNLSNYIGLKLECKKFEKVRKKIVKPQWSQLECQKFEIQSKTNSNLVNFEPINDLKSDSESASRFCQFEAVRLLKNG
jgi:hypothetical protein